MNDMNPSDTDWLVIDDEIRRTMQCLLRYIFDPPNENPALIPLDVSRLGSRDSPLSEGVGLLLYGLHFPAHERTTVPFGCAAFLVSTLFSSLECFSELDLIPTSFENVLSEATVILESSFFKLESHAGISREMILQKSR
jgi:hypothetical protein